MIDVADSNTVYYYHFDGLGSVIALSDVNSVIVERYSYDVFGGPNTTSTKGNPYLFTGRRFDNETALYYYRARYYDYYLGRFLQTDPIGYDDGLNVYTYAKNSPSIYRDSYGLKIELVGSDKDKKDFRESVNYLSKTSLFRNTYDYLNREDTPTVRISISRSYIRHVFHPIDVGGVSSILFNPILGLETLYGEKLSPAVSLAHEMEHARILFIGGIDQERNEEGIKPIEEEYIVKWFEGPIARELGEGARQSYYDVRKTYKTRGPTKTCRKKRFFLF